MFAAITWFWLAIVVSFVWKMAFGSVVYARPVLGNWWMKEVGLNPDNIDKKAAMRGIMITAVWALIASIVYSAVWSWTSGHGVSDGWMVGAFVGLIAATASMVHPIFEGRSMPLMFLYGGYHFVEFIGMGIIFGLLA